MKAERCPRHNGKRNMKASTDGTVEDQGDRVNGGSQDTYVPVSDRHFSNSRVDVLLR